MGVTVEETCHRAASHEHTANNNRSSCFTTRGYTQARLAACSGWEYNLRINHSNITTHDGDRQLSHEWNGMQGWPEGKGFRKQIRKSITLCALEFSTRQREASIPNSSGCWATKQVICRHVGLVAGSKHHRY